MRKIIKDIYVENDIVTIKEDKMKQRSFSITSLSGAKSYAIQKKDHPILVVSCDVTFKIPVSPFVRGLYEIGLGEEIWRELDKYYSKKAD